METCLAQFASASPTGAPVGWGASERSSWLEIDVDALRNNAAVFRALLPASTRLGAVVKADAYGHGLAVVLPALHAAIDVLYTIAPGDALRVRAWERAAAQPARQLLVLGVAGPGEVVALAAAGVEVVVGDRGWREWVAPLRAAGAQLRVHVHVDTGLGREGFLPEQLEEDLGGIADVGDALRVVGVLTHFADTEDVTEQAYARRQLARFADGERVLASMLGPGRLERHAAASAPAMVLPESRLDAARVGISMYGLWPSRETRISARLVAGELPTLRPVLGWKVWSQHVKELPAGSFVGYGCTHRCRDRTRVAVLPVGYHDGYPRSLSNRAHVLVDGRRCPVLGRVMMNHLIVDITGLPDSPARVEATLIGRSGGEELTADDLADWAGSINYEIVARLPTHLPRRVVDGGVAVCARSADAAVAGGDGPG
jgi:alanine racemase